MPGDGSDAGEPTHRPTGGSPPAVRRVDAPTDTAPSGAAAALAAASNVHPPADGSAGLRASTGRRAEARRSVRPADGPSVLPDVTTDERDVGWGEVPEPDDDERFLREVPPHHGS